jgi:gamma-glutamyl-gamma-aminobutyrate hydrolase PuuD
VSRPVVGVCVAVDSARYGPWDQDVAMVPASLVAAVHEHGWLALLITPDAALASEPEEVLRLLDGLIVPAWAARADAYAEVSQRLADAAEARGLPVAKIVERPDATVEDYSRAIAELFATPGPRVPRA